MRYITGAFGVIAACGFVVYSAVTTFHVAHDMTTEFKELAGWAASGIVLWECLGLLYVRQCWNNGSRLLALGGLALVLAAGIYTVRLDLRFNVAGQSDLVEGRRNSVQKLEGVKSELQKARADREALRKLKRPTDAQNDEMERLAKRIDVLESRWDTSTVVSTPMPEAGWASRMLGGVSKDEVWWTDALMVFGLAFWALARMLALPLAIASMQGAVRKPAIAGPALHVPDVVQPAISPRPRAPLEPRKDVLAIMAGTPGTGGGGNIPDEPPSPPADSKPVEEPAAEHFRDAAQMVSPDHPKPVLATADGAVTDDWKPNVKPRTKAERLEAVDVITRKWLDSGAAVRCAISAGSFGIHVYNAYSEWAASYGIKPVNPSHFGRSMRRLKVAFRKEAAGVRYGLRVIGQWGVQAKQRRAA